MSLSPA